MGDVDNKFSLTLTSSLADVDRACREAEAFFDPLPDREGLYSLRLVLRELLLNAVQHGEGPIHLQMIREGDHVRLVVEDQGDGWDWDEHEWELPCETDPCGRGLFLVRKYASDVSFNSRGNRIEVRLAVG